MSCGGLNILPNMIGIDQIQGESEYNLMNSFIGDEDSIFPPNLNSPYVSSDDFYKKLSPNVFSLLSVNVRSISGKINELANFLGGNEQGNLIDCVAIQEIWNVPPGVQYTVDGYHPLFYKIRDKSGLNANSGGGVGFLIKSNIEFEILESLSIFKNHIFESLFIKIFINKNDYLGRKCIQTKESTSG